MIKLGVIGISEGNGHPYSWSAIFNGYNQEMASICPYPIIPKYLGEHEFPAEQLTNAVVTHVWTQDLKESERIAKFSKIENVCSSIEELLVCDAILLARDDAESHFELAEPFLKAGIPVFIDKPFALSLEAANRILNACVEPWMVFSCTTLRFAKEFELTDDPKGSIHTIEAVTPKRWSTYGVHILEPSLRFIPNRGKLISVERKGGKHYDLIWVFWENAVARYFCSGDQPSELSISAFSDETYEKRIFQDSFSCFKRTLDCFIEKVVKQKTCPISTEETLEIVKILELGKGTE